MSILANGQYQIASSQFPGQSAVLLDGQPTANIVIFSNTSGSSDMVWDLVNVGSQGNQFQFINTAPTADGAFAGLPSPVITPGAALTGSTNPLTWTLLATCVAGEYWVLAPMAPGLTTPSGLAWSIDSGEDKTPITLEAISSSSVPQALNARASPYSQAWTFLPFTPR